MSINNNWPGSNNNNSKLLFYILFVYVFMLKRNGKFDKKFFNDNWFGSKHLEFNSFNWYCCVGLQCFHFDCKIVLNCFQIIHNKNKHCENCKFIVKCGQHFVIIQLENEYYYFNFQWFPSHLASDYLPFITFQFWAQSTC